MHSDNRTLSIECPKFSDSKDETDESKQESLMEFTEYLNKLAADPNVWRNQTFLEFCEVSSVTFSLRGCVIYKEGIINKRSGGRYMEEEKFGSSIRNICRGWSKRWFVITDQYLVFNTDSLDKEPNECMLIDNNFHVIYGVHQTGDKLGMIVINNRRKLELRAHDAFELTTWLRAFKTAIINNGLQSRIIRKYDSFSPDRPDNHVEFFADGHDYFTRLYDELMKAERQIFITDWWITPEIYLKRPVNFDDPDKDQYRLDNVLGSLAKRGVKIYILIWKEVEIGGQLYNFSRHSMELFASQSKNINVIRHPNTLISFWSHHEKICVIDQKKAFVGGIDICMGRYDLHSHPLKDYPDENGNVLFPGMDYSNSRTKDFSTVDQYQKELIDRKTQPRMPWHDLHLFVDGQSAQDLGFHFIEYWNNARNEIKVYGDQDVFLWPIENLNDALDKARGRHIDGSVDDLLDFDDNEEYGVIGKDYIEYLLDDADEDVTLDKGVADIGKFGFIFWRNI
jgi:phospholipase D1/2